MIFVGDHPLLFGSYRSQLMNLDAAYTDEAVLRARLEELLDAKVHRVHVRKIDLVNDTTYVEVRFQHVDGGRPAGDTYAPTELGVRR